MTASNDKDLCNILTQLGEEFIHREVGFVTQETSEIPSPNINPCIFL